MHHTKLLLLLTSLSCLSLHCKKEEKDYFSILPPATQSGKETAGCIVNGQVWLGSMNWLDWLPNGRFLLKLEKKVNYGGTSHISISLYDTVKQAGVYEISDNTLYSSIGWFGWDDWNGWYTRYRTVNNYKGYLIVSRLDTQQRIISGLFYFDAIETTTGDVVHVTDGRFDFKHH